MNVEQVSQRAVLRESNYPRAPGKQFFAPGLRNKNEE